MRKDNIERLHCDERYGALTNKRALKSITKRRRWLANQKAVGLMRKEDHAGQQLVTDCAQWTVKYANTQMPAEPPKGASAFLQQVWPKKRAHIERVRALIDRAVDGQPLPQDEKQKIARILADCEIVNRLTYENGTIGWQMEPRTMMDDVFVTSLGLAALFDKKGPLFGRVFRCANFNGSPSSMSRACRSYVLRISGGGPERSRYCSDACRNRVIGRELARKARDKLRLEKARKTETQVRRKVHG
jgi:hypothetical protein